MRASKYVFKYGTLNHHLKNYVGVITATRRGARLEHKPLIPMVEHAMVKKIYFKRPRRDVQVDQCDDVLVTATVRDQDAPNLRDRAKEPKLKQTLAKSGYFGGQNRNFGQK